MNEIINATQHHGLDYTLIYCAAITVLAVHLIKWIWEQIFGLPLETWLSPKLRKKQGRALIDELLGENDSHTKRELIKILDRGVYDSTSPSVFANYQAHCHALLAKCVKMGVVSVGIKETTFLQQKAFLDAISASLELKMRYDLASCLASHFNLERQKNLNLKDIVGIIGIKRGSPWLAMEFANQLKFPVAIHRGGERVNVGDHKARDRFDGALPDKGKVMIVDDSITGGTMVLEAIADLKALHIEIDSCLVLFEVLGKPGRDNLKSAGVILLTICTFDGRTNELKIDMARSAL
jgi:orotate phosphoribosyltransferase